MVARTESLYAELLKDPGSLECAGRSTLKSVACRCIMCGEVEDVVGALTPLAELCRFSMNFLLDSSCCSLRKRKGKRNKDGRKEGK